VDWDDKTLTAENLDVNLEVNFFIPRIWFIFGTPGFSSRISPLYFFSDQKFSGSMILNKLFNSLWETRSVMRQRENSESNFLGSTSLR
jgi:hypothetical protein